VSLGTTGELKQVFATRAIVELQTDRPVDVMRVLDGQPEVEKTTVFGTAVHAVLRENAGIDALAARIKDAGLPVEAAVRVAPSLEDVFLDLVERQSQAVPAGKA
jgi:ABC-2 type transport system ATP-binding protein